MYVNVYSTSGEYRDKLSPRNGHLIISHFICIFWLLIYAQLQRQFSKLFFESVITPLSLMWIKLLIHFLFEASVYSLSRFCVQLRDESILKCPNNDSCMNMLYQLYAYSTGKGLPARNPARHIMYQLYVTQNDFTGNHNDHLHIQNTSSTLIYNMGMMRNLANNGIAPLTAYNYV